VNLENLGRKQKLSHYILANEFEVNKR